MKRFLFGVFLFGVVASSASARTHDAPKAPPAGLSATTEGRLDWQMSKVIFSTWDGEEYDNSFPPIEWPRAMRTRGTELTVTIHTAELPEAVELRLWRKLRPNGIPKGKPRLIKCYLDAFPDECALRPSISTYGVAWSVAFEPPWRGRTYLATLANWPQAQVAWINHAILTR